MNKSDIHKDVFKIFKDLSRLIIITGVFGGLGWHTNNLWKKNIRPYQPGYAELNRRYELIIDGRYQLDYNKELTNDPNRMVFTSSYYYIDKVKQEMDPNFDPNEFFKGL